MNDTLLFLNSYKINENINNENKEMEILVFSPTIQYIKLLVF
jgi:hypothetical protein